MKSEYMFRVIPRYAAASLLFALIWNAVIYNCAIMVTKHWDKLDMTTALEEAIPLQTGWIAVYFGSYLFWAINYILISRRGKEFWFRFLLADLTAELICGILFIVLPCTNVRPEVLGNGVFDYLVRLLYEVDPAQNLFPSIHCLISWFCFLGLRTDQKLPVAYRVFCFLFSLAVCASTLFLKQHCLPDVVVGILLAQLCWCISWRGNAYHCLMRFFGCRS